MKRRYRRTVRLLPTLLDRENAPLSIHDALPNAQSISFPCSAGESLGYDRWLKANTVKTRTHPLFRQGLMFYEYIPGWPTHRLRPLVERFAHMLMEQRVYRELFGFI